MRLPGPVRAAVGLLVTAADEARALPERAIELPMLAVSTALQASLRAQQRYARLTARGDEALSRRSTGDEPPAWATFDDPVERGTRPTDDDGGRDAAALLDELFGAVPEPHERDGAARREVAAAKTAAAKKAAKKKAGAKKIATAKPADAKPATTKPVKPATAKPASAKPSSAKPSSAKPSKKTGGPRSGKSISSPRHTAPSRFDTVGDQGDTDSDSDSDSDSD